MRSPQLLLSAIIVLAGCGPTKAPEAPAPNRWSDARLLPVLEAQEHRNVAGLCALLKDTSATVRSAAALAFASVQDSASFPCLLEAISDASSEVRTNVVFALGFIANDSTVDRMAELSDRERDSTVQRAYRSALFLNLQRRGKFKELSPLVNHFESSSGQERMRAADAIRRLSPTLLLNDSAVVLRMVAEE